MERPSHAGRREEAQRRGSRPGAGSLFPPLPLPRRQLERGADEGRSRGGAAAAAAPAAAGVDEAEVRRGALPPAPAGAPGSGARTASPEDLRDRLRPVRNLRRGPGRAGSPSGGRRRKTRVPGRGARADGAGRRRPEGCGRWGVGGQRPLPGRPRGAARRLRPPTGPSGERGRRGSEGARASSRRDGHFTAWRTAVCPGVGGRPAPAGARARMLRPNAAHPAAPRGPGSAQTRRLRLPRKQVVSAAWSPKSRGCFLPPNRGEGSVCFQERVGGELSELARFDESPFSIYSYCHFTAYSASPS